MPYQPKTILHDCSLWFASQHSWLTKYVHHHFNSECLPCIVRKAQTNFWFHFSSFGLVRCKGKVMRRKWPNWLRLHLWVVAWQQIENRDEQWAEWAAGVSRQLSSAAITTQGSVSPLPSTYLSMAALSIPHLLPSPWLSFQHRPALCAHFIQTFITAKERGRGRPLQAVQ